MLAIWAAAVYIIESLIFSLCLTYSDYITYAKYCTNTNMIYGFFTSVIIIFIVLRILK